MLVRTLRRRSLTASVSLKHTSAITASSSRTSASVDIKGDDQHGLRGVDYQPSGQQTIRQEAADAVDAAWGPSFAADQDEGTQRGSGRPILPLVSEIQAATTNAGTRAQGGLTPDLLTLSILDAAAVAR